MSINLLQRRQDYSMEKRHFLQMENWENHSLDYTSSQWSHMVVRADCKLGRTPKN